MDAQDYGKAKLALHNAKQTLEALEKKYRKRTKQIKAYQIELGQLEKSLPSLIERMERAKADLKAAREAYRELKRRRLKSSDS